MIRLLRTCLIVALLTLAGACSRHKIIPDKQLAQIFHDAFLANAYIGTQSINMDSLNVYEPIFTRYGYTTADVQYTIGNFSKRKSARLGDVVEQAIETLEQEGKHYNAEVAALDTIDNVARRSFTRTIFADSIIRVRALRDTSRLHFSFDVIPGEYLLELKYLVDSLDLNENGLRAATWLESRDSSRVDYNTIYLRRNRTESFSQRFTVDTSMRSLRLNLLNFQEKPRRPSMTITDMRLTHTPPTRMAVESLYMRQLDIRIFANEFFRAVNPKDSL